MSDYGYKDGRVYVFHDGVLTVYGCRWTVELVAWPDPRISVLRDERPADELRDPVGDVERIGDRVLSKGEDTSFWARGYEEPMHCEGPEIDYRFMPYASHPLSPPENPVDHRVWRASFPSRRHVQLFWQTIPSDMRRAIHLQPIHHWILLSVFQHCPHALDLCLSNPMLFHLLMEHYVRAHPDGTLPFDEIESWVLRKQVDIMTHLNLPASESNRRILLKVIPEAMYNFEHGILAELEKDREVHRIVEHLPRINSGIAHILAYHGPSLHLTGPLLTEIARLKDYESMGVYFDVFNDTVDLLDRAGMKDKRIYSVQSLERLHDDILQRLGPEALMTDSERKYAFPPPPYPGTEHIEPITTPEALFKEGMEMRHCVAIYAGKIAEGKSYCYRVLAPARATLEIKRDEGGTWRIAQMRGKCNRHVGHTIVNQVWAGLQQSDSHTGRLRAASLYEAHDPQLPLLTGEELTVLKKVVSAFAG